MRKVVVFIISCILSFSSFAQGDVEWGEQKMYEDFDQFVEIINNYNPQIEIRKHVCNYDIIAELRKRRPAIDTIKSYGEFVNFMSNNVKIVCDIHTKMFIFLSHDKKIWSEILSDNVLQIDTTRHFHLEDVVGVQHVAPNRNKWYFTGGKYGISGISVKKIWDKWEI